jgi:hypothetical protein
MNSLTWLYSGTALFDMRRSLSSSWGLSAKLECGRSVVMVLPSSLGRAGHYGAGLDAVTQMAR